MSRISGLESYLSMAEAKINTVHPRAYNPLKPNQTVATTTTLSNPDSTFGFILMPGSYVLEAVSSSLPLPSTLTFNAPTDGSPVRTDTWTGNAKMALNDIVYTGNDTVIPPLFMYADLDLCKIPQVCDCSAQAMCNATGAQAYTCTCNEGYTGDGKVCTDVNECTADNGGCQNAACNNTVGSFTCTCNVGYDNLTNGTTCMDVDECATNNGNCSVDATCTNSDGSFTCACNSGFNGDGKTCSAAPCSDSTAAPTNSASPPTSTDNGDVSAAAASAGDTNNQSTANTTSLTQCLVPTFDFRLQLTNIGMEGQHTAAARALFNVTAAGDGGYCLHLDSPTYGLSLYACHAPNGGGLFATYDKGKGEVRIEGQTVGCSRHFTPTDCARFMKDGACTVSFVYKVTVSGANEMRAADTLQLGGGTITCPLSHETTTYTGKLNGDHSFRISAAPLFKRANGLGWLMGTAAGNPYRGDWLFRAVCA